MERFLTNIALANAFYEQKKNYFDAYFPFILKIFEHEPFVELAQISDYLKKVYDINLPMHSIKNILSEKKDSILHIDKSPKDTWEISLTDEGREELAQLIDSENNIETRTTIFYNSFIIFARELNNTDYEIENVKNKIREFLLNHLLEVSTENYLKKENKQNYFDEFERQFILFLDYIKKNSYDNCLVFEELWKGVVVWNELSKTDIQKKNQTLSQNLEVYVDTNYVVSLLELHSPIINQSAIELHALLIDNPNINIKILDKTIDELENLLDAYEYHKNDYSRIEVSSVFYYLKRNGYNKIKINQLKKNMENLLLERKITIERSNGWPSEYQKYYPYIYKHILNLRTARNVKSYNGIYKSESAIEKSSHHDSMVLSHILSKKNKSARSIYDARTIFLTSNYNLVQNYNKITRRFEKFPSIIMDSTLTNYLYLLSPEKNSNLKLNQVLKAHSRYLLINSFIWQNYISTLRELIRDESITIEDYALLISDNHHVSDYLMQNDFGVIEEEEVDKILEKIKKDEEDRVEELQKITETANNQNEMIIRSKEELLKVKNENQEKEIHIKNLENENTFVEKQKEMEELERIKRENELEIERNKNKLFEDYDYEILKARKTVFTYVIFLLVSFAFKILEISLVDIEFEYKKIVSYIVVLILFSIPFIRSLLKHENIKRSFGITFSLNYKKNDRIMYINQKMDENR